MPLSALCNPVRKRYFKDLKIGGWRGQIARSAKFFSKPPLFNGALPDRDDLGALYENIYYRALPLSKFW